MTSARANQHSPILEASRCFTYCSKDIFPILCKVLNVPSRIRPNLSCQRGLRWPLFKRGTVLSYRDPPPIPSPRTLPLCLMVTFHLPVCCSWVCVCLATHTHTPPHPIGRHKTLGLFCLLLHPPGLRRACHKHGRRGIERKGP